jgi:hypothetical protein
MPAVPRRSVDRQPTGDDSDPFFQLCAQKAADASGKEASQEQQQQQQRSKRAPARRGVRRKPTGDADLELMAAVEGDLNDVPEPSTADK